MLKIICQPDEVCETRKFGDLTFGQSVTMKDCAGWGKLIDELDSSTDGLKGIRGFLFADLEFFLGPF